MLAVIANREDPDQSASLCVFEHPKQMMGKKLFRNAKKIVYFDLCFLYIFKLSL